MKEIDRMELEEIREQAEESGLSVVDPQLLQIYLQLNQEARDYLMDYANYLLSRHEHRKRLGNIIYLKGD